MLALGITMGSIPVLKMISDNLWIRTIIFSSCWASIAYLLSKIPKNSRLVGVLKETIEEAVILETKRIKGSQVDFNRVGIALTGIVSEYFLILGIFALIYKYVVYIPVIVCVLISLPISTVISVLFLEVLIRKGWLRKKQ